MSKAAAGGVLAAAASLALVAVVVDPFLRAGEGDSHALANVGTTTCARPDTGGGCSHSERSAPSGPSGRPIGITIPAIGLHAAIGSVVSTHSGGRWTIDPPKQTLGQLRRVYWWSEHAAPADPSTGAAYLYGHACPDLVCAFNDLHRLSKGDLVRVASVHGVLTYRVTAGPVRLAKTAAGIGSSSIYDYGVANRLVLITCGYASDGSSPFNWVVVAHLDPPTAAAKG